MFAREKKKKLSPVDELKQVLIHKQAQADEERLRADNLLEILNGIETDAFRETNNLLAAASKPPIFRKGPPGGEENAREIVDMLFRELRGYLEKAMALGKDYESLKGEFTSKVFAESKAQIQVYQRQNNILEFEDKIGELERMISSLQNENVKLHNFQQTQRMKIEDEERKNMEAWTARQSAENNLRTNHMAEKTALQNERTALLKKVGDLRHQIEMDKATFASEKDTLIEEHKNSIAQLNDRISQITKEHESAIEKITDDHRKKAKQIEKVHADEKERLRKDVNQYSAALLARDVFIPMPDAEIKTKFLSIVQEVDALARLDWRVDQTEYPNQVLKRLSQNQKSLKKQLLQDMIWVLLYEYIFCSPFRIFGEEGKKMECQWTEECRALDSNGMKPESQWIEESPDLDAMVSELEGQNYSSPPPSIEAERWRYVTVKECHAAVRGPVPSAVDPRAIIKKSFRESIDDIKQDFRLVLERLVTLDKKNTQAMDKMIMRAANVWLEFGMQRCRILVDMQESHLGSPEEKIQHAQTSSLKLIVRPELKRVGNSKGLDLSIVETVGGCDEESVEISMR